MAEPATRRHIDFSNPNLFNVVPSPPLRRPPGPLKLGPHFRATTWPSKAVRFRFGTRIVRATATSADGVHQNVLRLHVQFSLVQQLFQSLIRLLPSPAGAWIESCFPEWALPSRLILKKQKDGWDDEFETEKATYAKLHTLQGVVIPRFLGELRYENARAILLSDIGGVCLATPEGALLQVVDFRRLVYQAMNAFAPFGLLQDDNKLDNYHLIGDKVMVVDLERMNEGLSDKDELDFLIKSEVDFLAESYERTQYSFWMKGLIAIDK